MPIRKIKAKKYSGIYEFYKSNDIDKATIGYYFSFRDPEGTPKKSKLKAVTKEEAPAP